MATSTLASTHHGDINLATIARIDRQGSPWITLGQGGRSLKARRVNSITDEHLRLAASQGDPVIIGMIASGNPVILGFLSDRPAGDPVRSLTGQKLAINGHDEVAIRCGKASLTLTKDGKVLIRGAYILSRSSGANLIKGRPTAIN